MKKATVFFTLIPMSISLAFSQYRSYSPDEYIFNYTSNFYRWGLSKNATANQKITITGKNRKGKVVSVKTEHFNEDTLVTLFEYKDGKGKEKSKILSMYNGKHLMRREISKNGNLKYKTKNTFEGRYRTSYTKYNSKEKIVAKNENTFTKKEYVTFNLNKNYPIYKGKKLKNSITYKKGGEKQRNKFVYEYDEEGKRTITTLYNSKNESSYVWDYTCKEEGALLASKNESNVCKWQEANNGMLIEVIRKTSPKGKIQKTINTYDADTNKVSTETYMDDVLSQKTTYDKILSKPLVWENYKKGKLKYKYLYVYADNGKVLNTKFYGKDATKLTYEENFIYKDEQLITVENYSKGKLIRSYAINYQ